MEANNIVRHVFSDDDEDHKSLVEQLSQEATEEGEEFTSKTGLPYLVKTVENNTKTFIQLYTVDGSKPRSERVVEYIFTEG